MIRTSPFQVSETCARFTIETPGPGIGLLNNEPIGTRYTARPPKTAHFLQTPCKLTKEPSLTISGVAQPSAAQVLGQQLS